jgi:hypothetical protein
MRTLTAMARLPLRTNIPSQGRPLGLSRCDSDEECSWEFTLLQDLRTTRDSRDRPDCLKLAASACRDAQCVVEAILSRQLNDLEPQLTRDGNDIRSLVEQFDAKPSEIRQLRRADLDPERSRELVDEMRAAGRPT